MVVEHGWLTGMEMIAEIEQANEIKGDAFEKQNGGSLKNQASLQCCIISISPISRSCQLSNIFTEKI